MFGSAARALLSKTLNSLLCKYVINVNVEDIELFLGWQSVERGIVLHLCNVQLREGAELFSTQFVDEYNTEKNIENESYEEAFSNCESGGQDDEFHDNRSPDGNIDDTSFPTRREFNGDIRRNKVSTATIKLGSNGTIGSFHVRMIGNDLHLNIDDADLRLILEITHVESFPETEDEAGDEKTNNTVKPNDVERRNSTDSRVTNPHEVESKNDLSDKNGHNFTGDETKQKDDAKIGDGWIARMLSTLPHVDITNFRGELTIVDKRVFSSDANAGPAFKESELPQDINEAFPSVSATSAKTTSSIRRNGSKMDGVLVEIGINTFTIADDSSIDEGDNVMNDSDELGSSASMSLNCRDTRVNAQNCSTCHAALKQKDSLEFEEDAPQNALCSCHPSFSELLKYGKDDTTGNSSKESYITGRSRLEKTSVDVDSNVNQENLFLRQRIRLLGSTGGCGLFVRIHRPSNAQTFDRHFKHSREGGAPPNFQWARSRWEVETNKCLLRCSEIDIRTKIYRGKKNNTQQAIETESEKKEPFWGDEFDIYTMDSMLVGFDYSPPSPSIEGDSSISHNETFTHEEQGFGDAAGEHNFLNPDYMGYMNAVPLKSSFHRIFRECRRSLTPAVDPMSDEGDGWVSHKRHSLDDFMPFPGVVLNVFIGHQLEVNIDHHNLEVAGFLNKIFSGVESKKGKNMELDNMKLDIDGTSEQTCVPPYVKDKDDCTEEVDQNRMQDNQASSCVNMEAKNSFPSCMKPEFIHVIGLCVSRFCFRVQIFNDQDEPMTGHTYSYWEYTMDDIIVDTHCSMSDEMPLSDTRLLIGQIGITEFRGICQQNIFSLSSPLSFEESGSDFKVAAAKLLSISQPLTSRVLSFPNSSAIKARIVYYPPKKEISPSSPILSTASMEVIVGFADLCISKDKLSSCTKTLEKVREAFYLGDDSGVSHAEEVPSKVESEYKVVIHSGSLIYDNWIHCDIPYTELKVKTSTASPMLLESIFENLRLEIGGNKSICTTRENIDEASAQPSFLTLPSDTRMRILLFLSDLSHLETAVGIRCNTNVMIRHHELNSQLEKISSTNAQIKVCLEELRSYEESSTSKDDDHREHTKLEEMRRNEILSKFMTLDTDSLEELFLRVNATND